MKLVSLASRPVDELPAGRVWIIRGSREWGVLWRSRGRVVVENFLTHGRAVRFADALTSRL